MTVVVKGYSQTTTCLLLASTYSGLDIVKYLIRHLNADVTTCVRGQETVPHKACMSRVEAAEKVEFIVENYPFMAHAKTSHGTLAVHVAARCDKVRCLEVLLKSDPASVNRATSRGLTPLHIAAYFGCKNAVEFLLSWDYSDVNAQDLNEDTPAHHAACYKHTESANFKAALMHKQNI